MKLESEVQSEIQLEGPKHGCILMRNNVGAFKDASGRVVFYGLGNVSKKHSEQIKSSDLIGITTILITQDMVGKKVGVFTAIEAKRESWSPTKKLDKHEQAQKNFIDFVVSHGGVAGFVNGVDSYLHLLRCFGNFTR